MPRLSSRLSKSMSVRCLYDLYHLDPLPGATYAGIVPSLNQAASSGWPLFLHKLNQGLFDDPKGVGRLSAAMMPGSNVVGIGGYMFVTMTESAATQVAAFVRQRTLVGHPLVNMVDFEPVPASTAAERLASDIVNALHSRYGMWPLLYTGRWNIAPIPLDNLPACPLMLAEYGTNPVPPKGWPPPIWHQYSDGTAGPHPVDIPGVGFVDQSEFLGSDNLNDAISWWRAHSV